MASPVDRRLLGESRAARTQLVLAALLGILSAALIIAQAVLLAYVIDRAAMYHATVSSPGTGADRARGGAALAGRRKRWL